MISNRVSDHNWRDVKSDLQKVIFFSLAGCVGLGKLLNEERYLGVGGVREYPTSDEIHRLSSGSNLQLPTFPSRPANFKILLSEPEVVCALRQFSEEFSSRSGRFGPTGSLTNLAAVLIPELSEGVISGGTISERELFEELQAALWQRGFWLTPQAEGYDVYRVVSKKAETLYSWGDRHTVISIELDQRWSLGASGQSHLSFQHLPENIGCGVYRAGGPDGVQYLVSFGALTSNEEHAAAHLSDPLNWSGWGCTESLPGTKQAQVLDSPQRSLQVSRELVALAREIRNTPRISEVLKSIRQCLVGPNISEKVSPREESLAILGKFLVTELARDPKRYGFSVPPESIGENFIRANLEQATIATHDRLRLSTKLLDFSLRHRRNTLGVIDQKAAREIKAAIFALIPLAVYYYQLILSRLKTSKAARQLATEFDEIGYSNGNAYSYFICPLVRFKLPDKALTMEKLFGDDYRRCQLIQELAAIRQLEIRKGRVGAPLARRLVKDLSEGSGVAEHVWGLVENFAEVFDRKYPRIKFETEVARASLEARRCNRPRGVKWL